MALESQGSVGVFHTIFLGVIMVYSVFWGYLDSLEEDRSVGGGVSSIVVK